MTTNRLIQHGGFTLIELMVVVAILGILVAIVIANLSGVGAKGRDAERQADLRRLEVAINQYKQQNGRYPEAGCGNVGPTWTFERDCSEYILGLAPTFIPSLPHDPKRGSNEGYSYMTNSNGTVFKLVARRTVESEVVTHEHTLKSCDVRVANEGGSLVSGSSDREVIGWCGQVTYSSNNLPAVCDASRAPFSNSYGIWGGFAAPRNVSSTTPAYVQDTTTITCR